MRDLKEILDNYESTLCDKIFRYELNHKINLDIIFYREHLCHLLGIQHIFGKNKSYLGKKGYERIKCGDITLASLKRHNRESFNKIKLRIEHFNNICELLCGGTMLKFYQYRSIPFTHIVADFLIYQNNKEYIFHLFLHKEQDNSNQYYPVSFIVKSYKDKNKEQFINRQEQKKITKFSIIENSKR